MNVRNNAVRLLGAAALVACLAGWATAGTVLDQSFESGMGGFYIWGGTSYRFGAQTLTTGGSGDLVQVELYGYAEGSPGAAVLEIRNGSPTGTLLGTASMSQWAYQESWHTFDFSSTPISLSDGQTIALCLVPPGGDHSTGNEYFWRGSAYPDLYAGGVAYSETSTSSWAIFDSGTWDLRFRTYMDNFIPHSDVTVPEPGSMVLFATGAACVLGLLARRRTTEVPE